MKKGIVLMAALLSALAFSACGQQTASQSVKAETETAATEEKKESKEITVSEEAESEKADTKKADTKKDEAGGEEKAEKKETLKGKLSDKKDFMITIDTADGKSYALSFDEKEAPAGLDKVKVGDEVEVSYSGTLSEVDSFTGKVYSVSAVKK